MRKHVLQTESAQVFILKRVVEKNDRNTLIQHVTETQCYFMSWPKTMKNSGINLAQLPESSDKDNVRSVNKLK